MTIPNSNFNRILSLLSWGFHDYGNLGRTNTHIVRTKKGFKWSIESKYFPMPVITDKAFRRLLKKKYIRTENNIDYFFDEANHPVKYSLHYQIRQKPSIVLKQDSRYKKYKRKMEARKNRHWTAKLTDEQLKFVQEIHTMEDAGTAKAITGHPSRGKFTLKKKKLNKKYRRSTVKNAKPND